MATATQKMRKSKPTNPFWQNFGEATGELKLRLENLGPEAKQTRKNWLAKYQFTAMPLGPYPLWQKTTGWMKAWINDKSYQACYVPRGDLNFDVGIRQLFYNDVGIYQYSRPLAFTEGDTDVGIRLCQEYYDPAKNTFGLSYEKDCVMTVDNVIKMIRTEVANWPLYDDVFGKQ